MSRLLKFAALLLATLWLPATLHCQLEATGLGAVFRCTDKAAEATHGGAKGCADDGCQTLETGHVVFSKARLAMALPAELAYICHFCLFEIRPPEPAPEFIASRQDETLRFQRTWQFDRRAARPARAPGLNA